MLVTWSRCECETKMWSIFASASSDRSPTPVPASTSTSSSTRSEVVRNPPPMPPLHPNTLILISCPRAGADFFRAPGAVAGRVRDRSVVPLSENVTTGGVRHSTAKTRQIRRGRAARARPCARGCSRLVEELHLDACDLDEVVVVEGLGLAAERGPVERGIGRALDVGDEIAVG